METFCVKIMAYNFYEDKFYPLFHLVEAENGNEAYDKAMDIHHEIESSVAAKTLPDVLWFNGVPYFNQNELIKDVEKKWDREGLFLQKRHDEWYIYDNLYTPPLEKLEYGIL